MDKQQGKLLGCSQKSGGGVFLIGADKDVEQIRGILALGHICSYPYKYLSHQAKHPELPMSLHARSFRKRVISRFATTPHLREE